MEQNPFWDFSLALYANSEVKNCCLDWQNRHNVNVNLVLFCCWLGRQSEAVTASMIVELQALIAPLDQQLVVPIRQLRWQLEGYRQETRRVLRSQLLDAELSAERLVQDRLHRWFLELKPARDVPKLISGRVGKTVDASLLCSNLNRYLGMMDVEPVDVSHGLVRAAKSVKMQTFQSP